jgi:MurNAc alpha-1-phosphate uridylyltransferase
MQCVVLAGGLGTRMRAFTEQIPKALIPVEGIPFIDLQLAWMASHGVSEVVLSIGYRGDLLKNHVGDGERFGIPVRYVDEGSELRGTGGALRFALEQAALAETFLVTYGDSFLPIDFAAVGGAFRAANQPAAMTVLRNAGRWDTSNVVFDNGRLIEYDKKRAGRPAADYEYIDYGVSVLTRSVIAQRVPARGTYDLADLFHNLSVRGELAGIEVFERFYEVGSPHGLRDFSEWVATRRAQGGLAWASHVV